MANIEQAWNQIEGWYKKNAPEGEFFLAPGARAESIKVVESELGFQLPNAFKQSYRLHDGSDDHAVFPYGFHLLSLNGILSNWKMWRNHVESNVFDAMEPDPEGPIRRTWWNLKWVPFTHNTGGDHHCVDMDPAIGGDVGQVIKFSHEVGVQKVLASSFDDWLSQFAAALESDSYRYDLDELWVVPASADDE